MACGSCSLLSFGKRRKRAAKKDEDEDEVKGRGKRRNRRSRRSRRSRRGSRRSRRSRRGSRKGSKRSRRTRRRRSRRSFGIVAGPGYKGQTSFQNGVYSNYFGSAEPFLAASEWWAPVTGGVPQYPKMLYKNAGPVNYPGN